MFNILFDISPTVPVIVLICFFMFLTEENRCQSLPLKSNVSYIVGYSNPMRIHLSQRYPIISQVTIIPVYRNYIHHIPLYWLFPHHFPISWCVKSDENPIFYIFLDIKIPFKSHKNPLLHLFPSFSHEKTHKNPRILHGSPWISSSPPGHSWDPKYLVKMALSAGLAQCTQRRGVTPLVMLTILSLGILGGNLREKSREIFGKMLGNCGKHVGKSMKNVGRENDGKKLGKSVIWYGMMWVWYRKVWYNELGWYGFFGIMGKSGQIWEYVK